MKKRLLSLLLMLALLSGFAPVQAADAISGVYEGYYYASQGQTGVTLTVTGGIAKFEFYNLPGQSNAEEGSFWMSVRQEGGIYYFDAGAWIEKPPTYLTADLELTLNGSVLSGAVKTGGKTYTFYAQRSNESYEYEDGLSSVYEGYYYASQGQTGVTLTITGGIAKFEFYNLPGRSNAEEGSFWMSVRQEDGIYYFDAGAWIEKPATYVTLDLELVLNGNVLSGTVRATGGPYTFYAERPNEAYEEIQDSIFGGHRYAVVSQGMTWAEASAYCARQGGYLATVTSQEELAFLQGLTAGTDTCWLGGQGDGSQWVWTNGEPWTFGAPPAQAGYLKLERGGSWSAGSGGERLGAFVCEWGTWSEASSWSSPELERAYEAGLIPDVLIGADMTSQITRGEFAAVVVELYEALTGGRAIIAADCPFTDIGQDASRLYILKAYNLDLVNGVGDNRYDPGASLTREQMATMLCRVFKLYQWPEWTLERDGAYLLDISGVSSFADDGDISDFARQSVYFMVKSGIIQGVGNNCFAPRNTTTQQEAAGYANATREQALALSLRSLEQF